MPSDAQIPFWRRHVAAAALFALGLGLTLHLWGAARDRLAESVRVRLLDRMRGVEEKLHDRVHAYENVLFGAAGFLQSSGGEVSPRQWRTFGESLALNERYKGFNAIVYVAMLQPGDVPAHESRMRRLGIPDYRVKGDTRAGTVSAVTLLYPDTYTRHTYGLDILGMGPVRRAAIERARDLGRLSLTAPLVPVANPADRRRAAAILAYVPVYDAAAPHATVDERRAAFRGFAFIATYVHEMIESLDVGASDVHMRLYDMHPGGELSLIATLPGRLAGAGAFPEASAAPAIFRDVQLGGRQWRIEAVAGPGLVSTGEQHYPALLLVLGLGLSLCLAAMASILGGTRRRARILADRMTAELRRNRAALEEKTAELEVIQTASPLGLFRTGADGRILLANPRAAELLRGKGASLAGSDWVDCLHVEERPGARAEMHRVVAESQYSLALECRVEGRHPARWVRITAARAGEGSALVGTLEDVTERKAKEVELERTREFLRAVLDMLPVGVWARDAQSRFVLENAYAVRFLGKGMTTVLGRTLSEVFGEAYAERSGAEDRAVLASMLPWSNEAEFTDLAGGKHWVRMFKRGLRLSNGELYVVGVNIDLTEQHELEMEARRSREFVAALLDALPTPLFVKDCDGRYTMVNRAFCQLHDKTADSIVGRSDNDLVEDAVAADNARVNAQLMRDRLPVEVEEYVPRPDGSAIWMLKNKALIDLPDGRQYIVGVIFDIDERVRAREELRQHRDNLQQLVEQRTAEFVVARDLAEAANRAKSEFLANMSHELRTPMHAVLSYASLGGERIDQDDVDNRKLKQYFSRIHASAARLLSLLNDLLDLAKLESGKMEYRMADCEARTLVDEAVREFEALCREKGLRLWVHPGPPAKLWADPLRIGQVLRNVLSNAIKFSPADGTIHVEWREENTGSRSVRISIRDEGMGIPEQELSKVFDKFVQSSKTKSGAGGTGLGLSICREIVIGHRGRIWAENNPSGGATFHLQLPVSAPEPAREEARALRT